MDDAPQVTSAVTSDSGAEGAGGGASGAGASEGAEVQCAICLDQFTEDNPEVLASVKFACNKKVVHSSGFHKQCIEQWLNSKDQASCPICRAPKKPPLPTIVEASRLGDLEQVNTLITDGNIDLNTTGLNGLTALEWASNNGHLDIVNALLEAGADLTDINANGNPAYHLALSNGHNDIAGILLDAILDACR